MKIFKKIQELTNDSGCFQLLFNDHNSVGHHLATEEKRDYYFPIYDKEDIDEANIDFSKDIFWFTWYDRNQVGFYTIYANNLEQLEERITNLIKQVEYQKENDMCE